MSINVLGDGFELNFRVCFIGIDGNLLFISFWDVIICGGGV